ncbi:MAG: TetR/AcrR family transcriptional regulator [Spirochaetales bacterium]|nr:TetR/AcrR family transcriptional regulator [Spirochaetales bacterium]
MKQKSEYKSSIRSRKMIRDAYIELMQEKELDKITITDIVKKADLNRGTFYTHYDYPRQVLEQIEGELIDKMNEFINEFEYQSFFKDPFFLLNKISTYFEKDLEFYGKLINMNGAEIFLSKLKDMIIEHIFADPSLPESLRGSREATMGAHLFAGGIVSLYQAWFQEKIDCPFGELAQHISKVLKRNSDFDN